MSPLSDSVDSHGTAARRADLVAVADLLPTQNIGGLASGLDTNSIITSLMAVERQPETRLKTQQSQLQQKKTDLQSIEDSLKALQSAAEDLKSPTLWLNTQSVDVNDTTKVAATRTGGAGTGGYQVSVTQLASASQHWFTYPTAGPSADDTITVGGHDITISAGSDITAAANTINSDTDSPVYASVVSAANGSQYIALSSKTTGSTSDFTVTDPGGLITEDASRAVAGVNAKGFVGAQAFDEPSNVIADAIPGVSLTLKGVTGPSSPITVTVGSPQPDTASITAKMKAFVDQYNSTIDLVRGKLNEAPVVNPQTTEDQLKGDLYGDSMLDGVLSSMRTTIYQTFSSGNTSYDQMAEIGISTGDAVGSGTLNQDAIAGKLVFDPAKFSAAITADPTAVRKLVGGDTNTPGFAQAMDNLLQPVVEAQGTLDQTISSADSEYRQLADQITDMEALMVQKQEMLQQQFTNMETAMQQSQAAASQVSGQLSALQT
jgi:flagellar hook-associated protein 2